MMYFRRPLHGWVVANKVNTKLLASTVCSVREWGVYQSYALSHCLVAFRLRYRVFKLVRADGIVKPQLPYIHVYEQIIQKHNQRLIPTWHDIPRQCIFSTGWQWNHQAQQSNSMPELDVISPNKYKACFYTSHFVGILETTFLSVIS